MAPQAGHALACWPWSNPGALDTLWPRCTSRCLPAECSWPMHHAQSATVPHLPCSMLWTCSGESLARFNGCPRHGAGLRTCDPGDGHAVCTGQREVDLLRLVPSCAPGQLGAVERQVSAAGLQAPVKGHRDRWAGRL